MTVKLKDMLNRLSPAEQHAVAARSAELIERFYHADNCLYGQIPEIVSSP